MSIHVDEPPFRHSEPYGFRGPIMSIQEAAVAFFFGKELAALQKRWEQFQKECGVDYLESWYLAAFVLDVEGVPAATIRMLDDIPQYIVLEQSRIEETK